MRSLVGVAAVGILAVSLTACSAVEGAANDAVNTATCAAVDSVSAQLAAVVEEATNGATADELRQQVQALRITAEGLAATVGSVAPEATAAIEQAAQSLSATVEGLPTDATAAAADQAVTEASSQFEAAINDALASLGC
jgi:TolA-binding protein